MESPKDPEGSEFDTDWESMARKLRNDLLHNNIESVERRVSRCENDIFSLQMKSLEDELQISRIDGLERDMKQCLVVVLFALVLTAGCMALVASLLH